jgi:hypothetical protein
VEVVVWFAAGLSTVTYKEEEECDAKYNNENDTGGIHGLTLETGFPFVNFSNHDAMFCRGAQLSLDAMT